MRLPFASTLDSSSTLGMQSRNTELGDVRISPRFLLWGGPVVNVGAGVGIYLPTSAATRVRDTDGADLVKFSQSSVTLSPYVGILFTPNDRLFSQVWSSVDIDTGGSNVSSNANGTGLVSIGRYRNGTQSNWDAQIGYWLINRQDPGTRIRGLAPFVELHYGTTMGSTSTLNAGAFTIGGGRRGDELNMTGGLSVLFGSRLNVQVGVAAPVINDASRNFNWQLGVRANYFFGPKLEDDRLAMFVP